MDALGKAISQHGSQAKLAKAIGVTPMAVTNWKKRGAVPADQCRKIELATGGKVKRRALRPDLFGDIAA